MTNIPLNQIIDKLTTINTTLKEEVKIYRNMGVSKTPIQTLDNISKKLKEIYNLIRDTQFKQKKLDDF